MVPVKAAKADLPQGTQCSRLKAASQGKAKLGGGVVPVRAARAVSPQRAPAVAH